MRYHLGTMIDCLKSNWYLYHCEMEDENGKIVEGAIQADSTGELIAEDSFEED